MFENEKSPDPNLFNKWRNEKIVETKTCKHCQSSFEITDKDLEFYEKVSPSFPQGEKGNMKKYSIPIPTLCPDCRQQRRLSFRNERKLYKRKCDATGKDIISIYSPDKPYKVYNQDFWWSDKWDALDYGKDFDFSKNFFEQFDELMRDVPHQSLVQLNSENSQYSNDAFYNKNTYLCFTSWETQDSFYVNNIFWSKNCVDGFWISESENCYNSIKLNKCFGVYNSINCFDCSNCRYLLNSKGCLNCLFCFGLNNKSYFFLNEEISKEEYNYNLSKLNEDKFFLTKCLEKFNDLLSKSIKNYSNLTRTEKCNGDFLSDCYNLDSCFDCHFVKNGKYIYQGGYLENVYDLTITGANSYCSNLYEGMSLAGSNFSAFGITIWDSKYIYYSFNCHSSSNLFGCIGLLNKSYCIFNKQYTKKEYETLVPKIIEHMMKTGEWGEFFPSSISPFGYNETVAMEYFPFSRDVFQKHLYQDGKQNFKWSDYESPFPKVDKIIKASMLPDDITKIPDDILNRAIMPDDDDDVGNAGLRSLQKPFRIIKQELEFYRKHNLPIPKRHPDQRHLDRMALRNPRKLFDRKCDKCGKEIKTTYSPDRKEIVYCEECYNREIY